MIKYFKKYAANKTSFFLLGSVYLAAGLTFLSLLFLLVYILVQGLPHINCDLFAFEYTTQNVSLFPAIIDTVLMVVIALALAAPLGIFTAIYLCKITVDKSQKVWYTNAKR